MNALHRAPGCHAWPHERGYRLTCDSLPKWEFIVPAARVSDALYGLAQSVKKKEVRK
jgi:hypothetical protein